MPGSTKLSRIEIHNEELPSIKSQGLLITWSWKVTWSIISVTSLLPQTPVPPDLLSRGHGMRSFHPKSYATLWTHGHVKVTSYIKNSISPLQQCLWPPNLPGWLHAMSSFLPESPKIPWSHGLTRPRDKLNALYSYHRKFYGH